MNESNKTITAVSGKNCWDCSYQQIAGDTFLGKCTWFSKHKREKDKDITPKNDPRVLEVYLGECVDDGEGETDAGS